jgi:hypothetical protein
MSHSKIPKMLSSISDTNLHLDEEFAPVEKSDSSSSPDLYNLENVHQTIIDIDDSSKQEILFNLPPLSRFEGYVRENVRNNDCENNQNDKYSKVDLKGKSIRKNNTEPPSSIIAYSESMRDLSLRKSLDIRKKTVSSSSIVQGSLKKDSFESEKSPKSIVSEQSFLLEKDRKDLNSILSSLNITNPELSSVLKIILASLDRTEKNNKIIISKFYEEQMVIYEHHENTRQATTELLKNNIEGKLDNTIIKLTDSHNEICEFHKASLKREGRKNVYTLIVAVLSLVLWLIKFIIDFYR